jgi:hypothetical protein
MWVVLAQAGQEEVGTDLWMHLEVLVEGDIGCQTARVHQAGQAVGDIGLHLVGQEEARRIQMEVQAVGDAGQAVRRIQIVLVGLVVVGTDLWMHLEVRVEAHRIQM